LNLGEKRRLRKPVQARQTAPYGDSSFREEERMSRWFSFLIVTKSRSCPPRPNERACCFLGVGRSCIESALSSFDYATGASRSVGCKMSPSKSILGARPQESPWLAWKRGKRGKSITRSFLLKWSIEDNRFMRTKSGKLKRVTAAGVATCATEHPVSTTEVSPLAGWPLPALPSGQHAHVDGQTHAMGPPHAS
jgi:hypothetical protein